MYSPSLHGVVHENTAPHMSAMLNLKQINSTGRFFYKHLHNHSPDSFGIGGAFVRTQQHAGISGSGK
jgi:hypothetical protein